MRLISALADKIEVFFVCVCACMSACVSARDRQVRKKGRKVGKMFQKERKGLSDFQSTTVQEHTVCMCTCKLRVFVHYYSLVCMRVFEMRVC